ncbi:MAG: CarD family transcriptional regulator [Intestinimonas sp.]|jgi:CarD family transcriptional regulator|nr:CarD family transcriptional regulator [Intestinimonas sp.]
MFQKGDLIIYGNTGVCRVEEVGPPKNIGGADRDRLYYTLSPVYGTGNIYIPVDTSVFMRPVISREEADRLIDRIPLIQEDICDSSNQRTLNEHYQAVLQTHTCEDLLQLIKTVYAKNRNYIHRGKKPGQTDQKYKKRAEDLLYGELSVALDIPLEKVEGYIRKKMAALEKKSETTINV